MKFYLINGSPRRNKNTVKLLKSAKRGIEETISELRPDEKVDIEILNLLSMNFNGCRSCFACKLIGGKYYGKCPTKDDLGEVIEDIWMSDGVIIGSPIYYGGVTGQTRNFIERFLFPKSVYGADSIAEKKMPTGLIFTMNVPKEAFESVFSYIPHILTLSVESAFTRPYLACAYNTVQFDDYSKYENYIFSETEKLVYEKKYFPKALDDAYNVGVQIAKDALELFK